MLLEVVNRAHRVSLGMRELTLDDLVLPAGRYTSKSFLMRGLNGRFWLVLEKELVELMGIEPTTSKLRI